MLKDPFNRMNVITSHFFWSTEHNYSKQNNGMYLKIPKTELYSPINITKEL